MIRHEFKTFKVSEEGHVLIEDIKNRYSLILGTVESYCLSSAEMTIAKRKLEESCFYAVKAIAMKYEES